ncbi:hypothetical protein FHS43_004879 [Streptosporangium becharense]|uniref:UPF0182 protein F4562_004327 n=1 Tax=Streptosporangium becharense TaxID=1816182 RepID=A0A7W9IIC3_9ACTN|nr:hypothetical protein [Streptosporangium becharense]MBB5821265.1 uncharacterized membrane protein (UPF0182 family) [Streptosporangium becharense]
MLLPVVVALAAIVVLFLLFAGIFTDYLWYDSVDYTAVFSGVVVTQILLFVVGALLMVGIVGGNMLLAYRMRPMFGPGMFGGASGADRYRMALDPHRKLIFLIGVAVLALFAGSSFSSQWKTWLEFVNATPFGASDELFNIDISFFMFTYPFIRMVLNFLFVAVVLSAVMAAIVHYLYGGFRLQSPGVHASRAARVHLSVLLGVFVLLKAVAYWVDRYGLVFSERGFVHGASYTDVNAVLPAKTILAIIALICAVLFFAGVVRPGGMLPGVGFGLLVLSAILIGGVYPALVEQFQVKPNQQGKEQEYIKRNIDATRKAYGVQNAEVIDYAAQGDASKVNVTADSSISGVRLLDPSLVAKTYQQRQRIRGYYDFHEPLDVDRYPDGNGTMRDTVVAVRELTGPPPAQNNWINRHLVYTHGYGFVAAPGNEVDAEGLPNFDSKDMPVTGPLVERTKLTESRIYFGEAPASAEYVIVGGGGKQELNYPKSGGTGQENTTYDGKGGVPVGSFFNRLLYAAKYSEINLLLSGDINDQSKILYERNPQERVAKVAPFLSLDDNPYPAIVGGRVVWIADAYTTSNSYPYSQSKSLEAMTRDTVTDPRAVVPQPRDRINYMRNSVKATVDAYDGTVTLYAWDEQDPILQTWRKAFPGVIKPKSEVPAELQQHLRYPEGLFKVQRDVLSQYHIEDAAAFYSGQDFWNVPNDPSSGDRDIKQPPYYLSVKMPKTSAPSFSLTTTFVPRQGPNLAAFMAVDATPGPDYGKLRILRMPSNTTIPGPGQVQNNFQNKFSGELNLLGLGQAKVRYGNLLTLPFADGLVYVEPVYVEIAAASGQEPYPILRRVLVSYGSKVGSADTLKGALEQVFGDGTGQPVTENKPEQARPEGNKPEDSGAATDLSRSINAAEEAYQKAQDALAKNPPDWTAYGEAQKELKEALEKLKGTASTTAPTSTASPSPTPSASAPPAASPSPTVSPSPTASPNP